MTSTVSAQITYLYKNFLTFTEEQLKQLNLSYGQLPFLLYIGKHPGCAPSEVKARLQMDWGHCQRSLTKLETEGFIKKAQGTSRKHSGALYLTELGEQAFGIGHQVFHRWDAQLARIFSPEDLQRLKELLSQVVSFKEGSIYHGTI